jgi:CRP-like cAMP-binding protein
MVVENLDGIKISLFEGIAPVDLDKLLNCLKARVTRQDKGGVILREQEVISAVGILLKGEARATRLDPSGKQFILAHLSAGSIYGYVLSLSPAPKSPVTVTAYSEVTILSLPAAGILNCCPQRCPCHERLIHNLLLAVSQKYFELQDRLACLIQPTLRDKLLFFLEGVANKEGSRTFNIPFDRAALAEYLNAERSALSRELSAMKGDGLIDYYKNTFKLIYLC